jgi:hypothetical protein
MARLRNPKHELFAIEIASGVPCDRAYVAAGYPNSKWARPNGAKLAQQPKVAARIGELQGDFALRGGLSAEYIQRRLLPLIEADLRELFEVGPDGTQRLRNLTDLPDTIAAALTSVKVDSTGQITEFKLASRVEAGKALLQSIGAIVEQHQHLHAHTDAGGLGDRIDAAFQRLSAHAAQDRSGLPGASSDRVADAVEIAEALLSEPPEVLREIAAACDEQTSTNVKDDSSEEE